MNEARSKISHLSEELDTVKQQRREDFESSMKTLHQEISEVPQKKNLKYFYSVTCI